MRTALMLTSNEHSVVFRTTTNCGLCDFLRSVCGFLPPEPQKNGHQYKCNGTLYFACTLQYSHGTLYFACTLQYSHGTLYFACTLQYRDSSTVILPYQLQYIYILLYINWLHTRQCSTEAEWHSVFKEPPRPPVTGECSAFCHFTGGKIVE